jgi:hypothetical protein
MRKTSKIFLFVIFVSFLPFTINTGLCQVRSLKLGIGPSFSMNLLFPDEAEKKMTLGGGLDVLYSAFPNFSLGANFGYYELGGVRDDIAFRTSTWHIKTNLIYNILPYNEVNPFIYSGIGLIYFDQKYENGKPLQNSINGIYQKWSVVIPFGVGANIFFAEEFALLLAAEYNVPMSDYLDDIRKGSSDQFLLFKVGINYFFFDKFYILRERKSKL